MTRRLKKKLSLSRETLSLVVGSIQSTSVTCPPPPPDTFFDCPTKVELSWCHPCDSAIGCGSKIYFR